MPVGISFSVEQKKIQWLNDELFEKVFAQIPDKHKPIILFYD
jgi:hypothetical protein